MVSLNQDETQPMPQDDETQKVPTTSEPAAEITQDEEISAGEDTSDGETEASLEADPTPKKRSRTVPQLIVLSLLALLVIGATSALLGWRSGINERTSFESTQVAQQVFEQYQLGVADLEAQRYELARQRFEYVINQDRNFPGVQDKLVLVLLELNTTATPTFVPTPTLSPTPDLRGAEELYSQSQVLLADNKWSEAIETLLKLRKDEPDYQPVKVDSMLYVALRNRGVERILRDGDLEGGTYDLALAEKFGPLDVEASNMRTWADLYKTGASFWGLDWGQATFYFGQIIVVAPNLRDNTNMTAVERFRIAAIKYGDVLAASKEWCLAQQQYEAAFSIGEDPSVQPTASWVTQKCTNSLKPKRTQPPPPQATEPIEPTATEAPPVEPTPTDEVTPEPTPEPTQDPYPPP
jgi:tetratricopeptide (TPR) repeat protein